MTNTPPVTIDPAVDQYLSTMDGPQRATLDTLRATIRNVVPHADECISYGLPAFALGGKAIAGYAGFAKHCSCSGGRTALPQPSSSVSPLPTGVP